MPLLHIFGNTLTLLSSDGVISKKELSRLVKDMYGMIQTESPDTVRIVEIVETFETVRFCMKS